MPPSLSAAEARALMGSEAAAPGDGLAGLRVGAHLSSSARRRGGRGSRAKRHGEDGYGKPVGGTAKGPEWRSSPAAAAGLLRRHPVPALFGCGLLFFMGVEYTIPMVAPAAPPLDLGFAVTAALHAGLTARPALNSFCAALNTVFVAMQAAYILWAILAEGRPRAAIAAVMMFTCRGVLGCSTQLPLPEGFLGSGMDFPVGNVSFFLFFSGHVAGAVIASTDMRRVGRHGMARLYDALNLLQGVRLLASRGHYTIDLAVGVGAGLLFDMLAGRYLESKTTEQAPERHCCSCHRTLLAAAS